MQPYTGHAGSGRSARRHLEHGGPYSAAYHAHYGEGSGFRVKGLG
jgi:hypothetical protein